MSIAFAPSVFVTGLTLSLSLIMAIGAQNTHVLRQGLRREHVAAVVAVCALLDIALMTLGVSGLATSLGQYPNALDAMGMLGALVLVYYGAQALQRAIRPGVLGASGAGSAMPVGRAVAQTLSISLLNPHVYLDTIVLVGAIGAQQPAGTQGAFLMGAGLGSVLWFVTLGFGARVLTPLFAKPVAWRLLDLLVAGMMWSIAAALLLRSLHIGAA